MVKRKAATSSSKVAQAPKRRKTAAAGDGKNVVTPNNEQVIEPKMTRSRSANKNKAVKKAPDGVTESGVHPLLIDHILDKVFQYAIWQNPKEVHPDFPSSALARVDGKCADHKTVHSLRLVCKQWNDTVTKSYRRERTAISFGMLQPFIPKSYDIHMQSFLQTMNNSSLIPVQRYMIGTKFFIKQNQRLLKDFMRICGPTVVKLSLFFDNTTTMSFTRRIFPNLNLSKLKFLMFHCDSYRGNGFSSQSHEIPHLLEVLLKAAKNLHELRFEIPVKDAWWKNDMVRKFGEVVCSKIPQSVKVLRLDVPLNDANLHSLSQHNLSLEEFQFDCHTTEQKDALKKFFNSQTTSLKVLKIHNRDVNAPIADLDFPPLKVLTHLEIQGANIKPFSYSETFPKLETLNCTEWKTEATFLDLLPFAKKTTSVTEIYLPYRFAQAPLVKKAAQCFPNLKSIHISPSPDISDALQEVFMHLTEVEALFVSFPYLLDNEVNVDSLFSGVDEQDCRRIMRQRNFDAVNLPEYQKRPSITNLRKLKKLVLEDSACDVILSDFTAHFIFLRMNTLKELHTSKFRMSSRYMEMLRNKLALTQVDDEYSDVTSDESDGGWSSDSSVRR